MPTTEPGLTMRLPARIALPRKGRPQQSCFSALTRTLSSGSVSCPVPREGRPLRAYAVTGKGVEFTCPQVRVLSHLENTITPLSPA